MKRFRWKKEYTQLLFLGGICSNFIVALLNGILGAVNQSRWQGTLCAYYLSIIIMKAVVVLWRNGQKRMYLSVSVFILVMNPVLAVIVYLMATNQGMKHYPGMLIYAVAFYAFAKVIAAVVNLVKARIQKIPVMLAMKSIGLVDGLVSILMLEIAMIDTFGNINTVWARMMMALSGTGVWMIAMMVGVLGIRWYRKTGDDPELRHLDVNPDAW